jgi:hypothetical protein
MLSLVRTKGTLQRAQSWDSNVERLVIQHKQNADKQIAWYKENNPDVSAKNILLRILNLGLIHPESKDPYASFSRVKDNLDHIVSSTGLTTATHKGDVHYGSFFGPDTPVAILANDKTTPAQVFGVNWRLADPVKVLHVPSVADSLIRPDMAHHYEGFGVVEIDVPLLAFCYHNWFIENMKKPADQQDDQRDFLTRFVLPNMIPTQVDKMLLSMYTETDEKKAEVKTAQAMSDATRQLWKEIQDYKEELKANSTLEQVLENIPVAYKDNALDLINVPKQFVTVSNYWVLMSCNVKAVMIASTLASANPEKPELRNKLKREQRKIQQEGTLRKLVDQTYAELVSLQIQRLETSLM